MNKYFSNIQFLIALLIAGAFFIYIGFITYRQIDFGNNYELTKGLIIDETSDGSGNLMFQFSYRVKGIVYFNDSYMDSRYNADIGDTVIVKYYVKDFSVSIIDWEETIK